MDHYAHGLKCLSPETSMPRIIERLGNKFTETTLEKSPYVQPYSVLYQMDGQQRRWDVVGSHNSVGVVVYHRGLDAFLLVRQFRPAMYAHRLREARAHGELDPPLSEGFTCELCAGLIDKAKSLQQIVHEEILEECGYDVPPAAIAPLATAVAAAGTSGSSHHMFFATVDEGMRATAGGGLAQHGEAIEVLALPFERTSAFVVDDRLPKSPGLMFGVLWAHGRLSAGELCVRTGGGVQTGDLQLQSVVSA